MLKQRVLTAVVLVPLAMAAIFAMPADGFVILLAAILLAGSWEYRRLAGMANHVGGYLLVLAQAAILATLFIYREHWDSGILTYLSASCVVWMLMFIRLPLYRAEASPDSTYRTVSCATALISITTGWFAVSWIRIQPEGSWLILLLLLIVWAADTGAYFAGKAFGKRKLAPNISPGKTRAGLAGGLVTASLVALLASKLMPLGSIEPLKLILLSFITALVSVGGDLMISLHKRTSGFKDSGAILPGHGGILDRMDSLLAAAPFFALGLLVIGF